MLNPPSADLAGLTSFSLIARALPQALAREAFARRR